MMIPIHTTVDVKTFAHVASYIKANGGHCKSKSEVLWFALETLANSTYDQGKFFTTTEEAIDYLTSIGLPLNVGNKRQKDKVSSLQVIIPQNKPQECIASEDYLMWQEASNFMRALGRDPISFEDFMTDKKIKEAEAKMRK